MMIYQSYRLNAYRILSVMLLYICASFSAQAGVESALVEVIVTYQESKSFMPWQHKEPGTRYGYGVFLADNRILTTESLVRNNRLIQIRKLRTGEKILATVKASDCAANIALLEAPEGHNNGSTIIADSIDQNSDMEILQFDQTKQLQRGKARAIQVQISKLPKAPYQILTYQLLADLNINGSGAMVVQNGALVGLMMDYSRSSRTGNMLPCHVIRQFLDDVDKPPYEGFASAGFRWKPLIDPVRRAYLGAKDPERGIVVLSCIPGTGAGSALKPDDVVIQWDGHDVDKLGFYNDSRFGRIAFSYLIKGSRRPGDISQVTLIRNKKEITVQVRLANWPDGKALIPLNITGEPAEYLLEAGFIIRELSGKFLKAHGGDWMRSVDPQFVHLYTTRRSAPDFEGERVVVVSAVLPDKINLGYQDLRNVIILRINKEEVTNMNDVFRIIDRDGAMNSLTVKTIGVDLVIDTEQVKEANKRIAALYRIPSLRHKRTTGQ